VRKCSGLPESFLLDHQERFPASDTEEWHPDTVSPAEAAYTIAGLFHDRPHVVGAVPNFDTERLAKLLTDHGHKPGWHYHLIDVENLAVGYLHGRRGERTIPLPWDSDALSRACGVEPPTDARHTAMGDADWAMALYDAITGP
jgi:hypothetical protein